MLNDIPPSLLALTAGFLFACGSQIQNLGVQTLDSRAGTMMSIGTNALIFWIAAPFFIDFSHFVHPAMLIFAALGLIRPAVSANLAVMGIKMLGPTLTTTLSATSPLFGAAFGILILGELLTWQIAVGTMGIILAVLALTRRGGKVPATWPLWALALPIGAAFIRSVGHGVTKVGMEWIPDPLFAGLVGATVSFIVTFTLWARSKDRPTIDLALPGPRWFLFAGIFFGVAILCLNTALLNGEVITVVPLVAASPVFSMLLSIFVFRREILSLRIVAAVFIVMPSVVLIALSH